MDAWPEGEAKEVHESNGFETGRIRSGTEIASGEGFKRKNEVETEMANGTNSLKMALYDAKAGSCIKMAGDDRALKRTEKLLWHAVEE